MTFCPTGVFCLIDAPATLHKLMNMYKRQSRNSSYIEQALASNRRGLLTLELLVAAVLLVSSASLVLSCAFAMRSITRSTNELITAQHEVQNHLEKLINSRGENIEDILERLEVSEVTRELLPAAALNAKFVQDEHGARIQLGISWNEATNLRPVTAVAWLAASQSERSEATGTTVAESDEASRSLAGEEARDGN